MRVFIRQSTDTPVSTLLTFNQRFRVPNFILAFIPAEIHPDMLNTMTAFAVCSCHWLDIDQWLTSSTDWGAPV